jgi:hypothetical protein
VLFRSEAYSASGILDLKYPNYSFVAQNVSLNVNPSANFTFSVDYKKPYRGINTQGLTSIIQLNFISQVPYDKVFFDNIFAESGIKNNFKMTFGDSIFQSGYLKSFNASIEPNNLIQNQAEFVFYNTGINGFTGSLGNKNYSINSTSGDYYAHGANTLIAFKDGHNEFSKHQVKRIDFNYSADIQTVYDINTIYPSRVIYNKEQIDLTVDLDTYGVGIRDINNVISGTKIIYTGMVSPSNGIEIFLKNGYLMNKNFNTKPNDIINSRISLKYFI